MQTTASPGYAVGPSGEFESDAEDGDYVPSGTDETEDETMDTEIDADRWLNDVDLPQRSRRR